MKKETEMYYSSPWWEDWKVILVCLTIFVYIPAFSFLAGCSDSRTTEACLISGDPECGQPVNNTTGGNAGTTSTSNNGAGGNGQSDAGTSQGGASTTGNNPCLSNPNFGRFCVSLEGHPGHFTCSGTAITPDCTADGTGGAGGGGTTTSTTTTNTGAGGANTTTTSTSTSSTTTTVINGGGVVCTTAVSLKARVVGANALTTLRLGDAIVEVSNDASQKTLINGDLLGFNADSGLSVSLDQGQVNVFEASSPGGDPTPLIDALFCRQLGIDPPTPQSCNKDVIGSHSAGVYMSALLADFTCWRAGICPASIAGHLPGDLFALKMVVAVDASLTGYTFKGEHLGIIEVPPHCQ